MKNIYLISGLGADNRIFRNLNFHDSKPKLIHWIKNKNNEKLKDYCLRLTDQIEDKKELILIGVSFGGIIAIELSKILKTDKVIIISSIKQSIEKPLLYRFAHFFKILKFVPSKFFTLHSFLLDFLFDVKSKDEKEMLKDFIKNNDSEFTKWSLNEILKWDNYEFPTNLIHIHGEIDKLFPFKYIQNPIPVIDGGHFMIFNKHKDISAILTKFDIL